MIAKFNKIGEPKQLMYREDVREIMLLFPALEFTIYTRARGMNAIYMVSVENLTVEEISCMSVLLTLAGKYMVTSLEHISHALDNPPSFDDYYRKIALDELK